MFCKVASIKSLITATATSKDPRATRGAAALVTSIATGFLYVGETLGAMD